MEQEQITLNLTAPTCDVFMTYGMVCCSSSCAAIGLFVKPVCARWKGNLDAFDTTTRCACDRHVLFCVHLGKTIQTYCWHQLNMGGLQRQYAFDS